MLIIILYNQQRFKVLKWSNKQLTYIYNMQFTFLLNET